MMATKMKKMVYTPMGLREVLYSGEYKGYEFYIMSLGTHPTAYVRIPKGHKYCGLHYDNIDIDVHGGLTFSEYRLHLGEGKVIKNAYFIGWDYAHWGDYMGSLSTFSINSLYFDNIFRRRDKKWTTKEIYKDVKSVIEQLREAEHE